MTVLWGISAYFGDKVALTQAGHLLGHVRDAKSRIRVSSMPQSFLRGTRAASADFRTKPEAHASCVSSTASDHPIAHAFRRPFEVEACDNHAGHRDTTGVNDISHDVAATDGLGGAKAHCAPYLRLLILNSDALFST